jgi:catechol 2,3-dioxygenase-like lactoylglutathione lyase family enzyme
MATIDHVTMRVADLEAGRELYDRVFDLLGFGGASHQSDGFCEWNDFSIAPADTDHPPTHGAHVAFAASSRDQVGAWWRALTDAGYRDDGAPGPRPEYGAEYYGGFIRDPAGNSVEAVHHESTTAEPGLIDHLWIRVPDLEDAKRFYAGVAPAVGLEARDQSDRIQLVADGATFMVLAGAPTRNLHLAVGVTERGTVADFHRAALAAGGRDNGAPGERPEYHPGYYGAYVLDPAGNNIEAVFHDRPASPA